MQLLKCCIKRCYIDLIVVLFELILCLLHWSSLIFIDLHRVCFGSTTIHSSWWLFDCLFSPCLEWRFPVNMFRVTNLKTWNSRDFSLGVKTILSEVDSPFMSVQSHFWFAQNWSPDFWWLARSTASHISIHWISCSSWFWAPKKKTSRGEPIWATQIWPGRIACSCLRASWRS